MKKLTFVVIGIIAVIGLLTAFDGDCRGSNDGENHPMRDKMEKDGGHRGMQYGYQMMCEELELTDTQKDQMEELRISSKKEMIVTESDLKILEIDKRSALRDKNFKQSKKLTGDIFKIKQKMAENRIEQQEQRWNILTPEQQEKADELRKEHPRRESQNSPKLKKLKRQ
ncbi:MAG: Spy/CpxP family protein refolding chaperone [Candidatus Tenebribacter burtonii]|jgi:Spy/CpxP family protein refolding chaperone|nr:Spy/CpxP family protein refolding chaperone [Candidatus Tenebribacter burtonii]